MKWNLGRASSLSLKVENGYNNLLKNGIAYDLARKNRR